MKRAAFGLPTDMLETGGVLVIFSSYISIFSFLLSLGDRFRRGSFQS